MIMNIKESPAACDYLTGGRNLTDGGMRKFHHPAEIMQPRRQIKGGKKINKCGIVICKHDAGLGLLWITSRGDHEAFRDV